MTRYSYPIATCQSPILCYPVFYTPLLLLLIASLHGTRSVANFLRCYPVAMPGNGWVCFFSLPTGDTVYHYLFVKVQWHFASMWVAPLEQSTEFGVVPNCHHHITKKGESQIANPVFGKADLCILYISTAKKLSHIFSSQKIAFFSSKKLSHIFFGLKSSKIHKKSPWTKIFSKWQNTPQKPRYLY